jgi:Tol biopolymer transport system component
LVAGGCGGSQNDAKVSLVEGGDLAAWSPDSRQLAVPAKAGVELVQADGSQSQEVNGPFPVMGGAIGWNARGTELHYLSKPRTGRHGLAATSIRTDGSGLKQSPLGVPVDGAAWARQGWPLAFIPNSDTIDIETGRVGPEPALWILPGNGTRPHQIFNRPGEERAPTFSPDGKRVAVVVHGRSDSVWVLNTDGSGLRRVVGDVINPYLAWSPDGRQLAMATATRSGDRHYRLYLAPATGGGQLQQVSTEEVPTNPPAWTPDGRWITYSTGTGEIKQVHPDGSGTETIADLPGQEVRDLTWSPDGKHLAYSARPFPKES